MSRIDFQFVAELYKRSMDARTFSAEAGEPDTIVLDTREFEAFGGAHIPDSMNIPLRQEFPIWAGSMLDSNQRILLVPSERGEIECVSRHLARIGIDNVGGYLRRGFRHWAEAGFVFHKLRQMSVHKLNATLSH